MDHRQRDGVVDVIAHVRVVDELDGCRVGEAAEKEEGEEAHGGKGWVRVPFSVFGGPRLGNALVITRRGGLDDHQMWEFAGNRVTEPPLSSGFEGGMSQGVKGGLPLAAQAHRLRVPTAVASAGECGSLGCRGRQGRRASAAAWGAEGGRRGGQGGESKDLGVAPACLRSAD